MAPFCPKVFLLRKKAFLENCPYTYMVIMIKVILRINLIFAEDGAFSKLAVYAFSIVFMGKSVNQCVK